MEISEKMGNHEIIRKLALAEANSDEVFRFMVTVNIPKSDPRRKTGKFLSLFEVCKLIGIKPTTYRRYEGGLFPKAKRLDNNYRIFTEEDVEVLREIWNGRR